MAESAKKATIEIARASRIFERYDGNDVRSVKQITRQSELPALAAQVRVCGYLVSPKVSRPGRIPS
jgi:hypothetical protein